MRDFLFEVATLSRPILAQSRNNSIKIAVAAKIATKFLTNYVAKRNLLRPEYFCLSVRAYAFQMRNFLWHKEASK